MSVNAYSADHGFGVVSTFVIILFFLPTLALTVRRLRDAGFSVWWVALLPIPFVGLPVLVMTLFQTKELEVVVGFSS